MYRPIPADWLSPWWDKQEGQLTEDTWSGKLFGFIWICLALQFLRKVKGESKNRTAASIGNFGKLHLLGRETVNPTSWVLYTYNDQGSKQTCCSLTTCWLRKKMKKIIRWRPWRFRPSCVKSAKWICTKRSEGGRYHCTRPASIWPPLDTFTAAGGCSKEL